MSAKQFKKGLEKAGVLFVLILGGIFAAFPVIWMLSNSFKTNTEIFAYPPRLITENFSLKAYQTIFSDPSKVRSSSTAIWSLFR
jgi:multiple sugar transport system permease protein